MFRHVYGRRSERQRKKALSRFSNTINDPVVVQEDDQSFQHNLVDQPHDVDEQTQHDNDILNTEIEDPLVEEIRPSATRSGKRKLKEAKRMHGMKPKKTKKDPNPAFTPDRCLRSGSKSSASRSRSKKVFEEFVDISLRIARIRRYREDLDRKFNYLNEKVPSNKKLLDLKTEYDGLFGRVVADGLSSLVVNDETGGDFPTGNYVDDAINSPKDDVKVADKPDYDHEDDVMDIAGDHNKVTDISR
ncbi:hypothetical protein L1887_35075 [Cichorium endivia]|nr:hypothetical protein L1887_35075 [Cichorium endivia]